MHYLQGKIENKPSHKVMPMILKSQGEMGDHVVENVLAV